MGAVDVGVHGDCVSCEDDSCGGQSAEMAEFGEEGLAVLEVARAEVGEFLKLDIHPFGQVSM